MNKDVAKKIRVKVQKIYFEVFSYDIIVIVSDNVRAAISADGKNSGIAEEIDEQTEALTVHTPRDRATYIFFPYTAGPGTIAHEAYHAVRNMLLEHGVKLDNETVAYHLGYLVDRITPLPKRAKK